VIEAIVGVKSEFVRTPKYRVEAGAQGDGVWAKKKYQQSAGGCLRRSSVGLVISAAAVGLRAANEKLTPPSPFLLFFVWGYLYTGLMSLAQTYFERFALRRRVRRIPPRPLGAPGFSAAKMN